METFYKNITDHKILASFLTVGWIAGTWGAEQYLQLDFEAIYDVTALEFAGSGNGWYTRKLRYVTVPSDVQLEHEKNDFTGLKFRMILKVETGKPALVTMSKCTLCLSAVYRYNNGYCQTRLCSAA